MSSPDTKDRLVSLRRRAAVLLEAILAMALLLFGMAAVGYQINTSLKVAHVNDLHTRALMLMDTKMAELDAGVLRPSWNGDELKGHFGIIYPGFSWQMNVKPAEIPNLYLVELEIGYNPERSQEQLDSPEMDIEIDDPGTHILRTAYRLVPKPADVSLQRDFGVTNEELDALLTAASAGDANSAADNRVGGTGNGGGSGGGGGLGGGGGGNAGDPTLGMLQNLIQAIVSGGIDPNSINPRDLAQYLDDETMTSLGPIIDMYFGNGLNAGQLPGALQNPALQQILTGRRGGRNGNRRGGRRGGDMVDRANSGNPDNSDDSADGRNDGRPGRRPNRDGNNQNDNENGNNVNDRNNDGNRGNDRGNRFGNNRGGNRNNEGNDRGGDRGGNNADNRGPNRDNDEANGNNDNDDRDNGGRFGNRNSGNNRGPNANNGNNNGNRGGRGRNNSGNNRGNGNNGGGGSPSR